jgi:DNA adenine methylase
VQDFPEIEAYGRKQRNPVDAVSPFRYPGGKGFLSVFLAEHLANCGVFRPVCFVEPFCGGAGAALSLLADGHVQSLRLNDADIQIYSAWRGILYETDRFIEKIIDARLDLDEWHDHCRLVSEGKPKEYSFELGFSTFYLNRTTRSGIVRKSGPIGGYLQSGKWRLDARFNKDRLVRRIKWIASQRDKIEISNLDALSFLSRCSEGLDPKSSFYFVDPPYVGAGDRLYLNSMTRSKHVALADMLQGGRVSYWMVTYDDNPLIHSAYLECDRRYLNLNYSLQKKRRERELIIMPRLG